MHPRLSLAAGIVIGLFIAFAPGCGSTNVCGPSTCSGCCNVEGKCEPGSTPNACGISGAACLACATNQYCQAGGCQSVSGGGGGGGGGTDAGNDGGASQSDAGNTDAGGGVDGGSGVDGGETDGGSLSDGGTGTDAGTDGGTGYTAAQFCSDEYDAVCAYVVRCGWYSSKAACLQIISSGISSCTTTVGASVKDGRAVLNATYASACWSFYANALSCNEVRSVLDINSDCAATLAGQGALNDSCFNGNDCKQGLYCDSSLATCPGSCQTRPGAGQPAPSTGPCAAGTYDYADNATCQPYAVAQGSCAPLSGGSTKQTCATGYYCDDFSLTCAALKPVGAACNSYAECAQASECTNGFCTAYGSLNAPCNGYNCKSDLTCSSSTPFGSGTCTQKQSSGGACWYDFDCAPGLFCGGADTANNVKGTCQTKKANGQPCTAPNGCQDGLTCMNGSCTPLKPDGSSCTQAADCASSYCNPSNVCAPSYCQDPTP